MRKVVDAYPDLDIPFRRAIAAGAPRDDARRPSYEQSWSKPARHVRPVDRASRGARPRAIAAAVVVVAGVTAIIGLRERIVRVWPPSAAVYAALRLPVNPIGLELRGLHSKIVIEGSRRVLTIEGEIVNLRRAANLAPPIALTVRGEDGQAKYAWTTPAPKSKLEAGEKIAFRARLASPPTDGADVLARFAGLEQTARSNERGHAE
ncbi:MAG: hypothetical protein HYS06_11790 [Methylocystis sp.]|nr:hypothetical protein [Methylocystis sp.]